MRILIAEDEPVIAQRIERLTKEILGDRIISIKKCGTTEECLSYLMVHQINLLFLDLNLKGKDGFDLLEEKTAGSFYTVIISAYSNRAIQAFNYPVIDFIEKPFDKSRLEKTFERLKNFESKHNFTTNFISLKKESEIKLIPIDEIVYLKGAGVYSELFLASDKKELHPQNLEKIDLLLPASFVRIHKSYIVNFQFVESITLHGGSKYSMILKNGVELPVSRSKYQELKKMLTDR